MPHVQDWKYHNSAHTKVEVGTVSTQVLPANPNRLYALVMNNSDAEIYLKLGANAVVGEGIPLLSRGSYYEMSKERNLYTGQVNAIHNSATGTKTVLVLEGS